MSPSLVYVHIATQTWTIQLETVEMETGNGKWKQTVKT